MMLVLTRKTQQSIVIDERVEIRVLEIRRGAVRLGISAPREVTIHREEILNRDRVQQASQPLSAFVANCREQWNAPAVIVD